MCIKVADAGQQLLSLLAAACKISNVTLLPLMAVGALKKVVCTRQRRQRGNS